MVKLSVIVPVYNVKQYLVQCLKSLDQQEYQDLEIIVVDDGSNDGSEQIVNQFCAGKNRFRIFHKENGGLMSAWLYGVDQAEGAYLGFVDSDDAVQPDMYEKMMKRAEETNADIVMCGRLDITKTTQKTSIDTLQPYYTGDAMAQIHDHVFPALKGGNISSARWNKVFKREVFIPNLKYCRDKSRYCEDRYIVPAALLTAKSFSYIPEPLYIYRMRKGANSKSPSLELSASLEKLFFIQGEMLRDKGLYERYKKRLEIAKLDYMKLVFERNLVNSRGIEGRLDSARAILSKENIRIILANRSQCASKFGKTLHAAAVFNSAWLLLLASCVNKMIVRREREDWFD